MHADRFSAEVTIRAREMYFAPHDHKPGAGAGQTIRTSRFWLSQNWTSETCTIQAAEDIGSFVPADRGDQPGAQFPLRSSGGKLQVCIDVRVR